MIRHDFRQVATPGAGEGGGNLVGQNVECGGLDVVSERELLLVRVFLHSGDKPQQE